jgi:CHASE3 domain sensor protein
LLCEEQRQEVPAQLRLQRALAVIVLIVLLVVVMLLLLPHYPH